MCGIFGLFSYYNNINISRACNVAKKGLKHRGPDSQNVYLHNNIGFAHTRLSILDFNKGDQPMISSNKNYVIVFNGEIVNFKDLKKILEDRNIKLKSDNSDTEILLELFSMFGLNILNMIKGMFSFAIYDKKENSIFLARDHMGIKPLYYINENSFFSFSSEIKTFYQTKLMNFNLNDKFLDEFIVHGNIAGSNTLHKKIFKLEPGHYLLINKKKLVKKKYWYPVEFNNLDHNINYYSIEKTTSKLESLLLKVISEWCVSDAPIGTLLSGGLDSTLISTIAAKKSQNIKFFTNYYKDNLNENSELDLACLFAKKLKRKHYISVIKENFSEDNLHKLVEHVCNPIMDLNSLTYMSLCKFIKNNTGVKVLLSGEGADELFGGYQRHFETWNLFNKKRENKNIILGNNIISVNRLNFFLNKKYKVPESRLLIFKNLKAKGILNKILENDQLVFLPAYLDRVDIISMMYGLEVRTPFLDERLVSFANQINQDFKIKNKDFLIFKFILKKVCEKYVSKKIVWNKTKYRFSFPAAESFNSGTLKKIFINNINSRSKISKFYDIKGLRRLMEDHSLREGRDHSNTLGRILTTEIFLKNLS